MEGGKLQQSENVVNIAVGLLEPNPYQPRKTFNENTIDELALSIKEYGILNPILVRKKADKYEIIAGERRLRAAKKAGLQEIPAIIKNIDDAKAAEIALIENLQRENLSPIEEAKSYKEILSLTNLTEEKLSGLIGKSQSAISNKMRLLALPTSIQNALNSRRISERHARSLLTLKNEQEQQELLDRIIKEKISVKELDSIISLIKQKELEKESDNMNNGNFFPNYNNLDQNNNNNNMSLNSMNMQASIPTPGIVNNPNVEPAPIQQEAPIIPNFGLNNDINQTVQPSMEQNITPNVTLTPEPTVAPTLQFNQQPESTTVQTTNPVVETTMPQESAVESAMNSFNEIPLFASQPPVQNQPTTPPIIEQPTQQITEIPPVVDTVNVTPQPTALPSEDMPLFGNNIETPVTQTSTYEVPVEIPTMPEDKFTQVKTLLDTNGVTYKAYTSDTGNCIIIEI